MSPGVCKYFKWHGPKPQSAVSRFFHEYSHKCFFFLLVFLSKEKMAAIDLYSLCVMEKAGHDLICKGQPSRPALRNTVFCRSRSSATKLTGNWLLSEAQVGIHRPISWNPTPFCWWNHRSTGWPLRRLQSLRFNKRYQVQIPPLPPIGWVTLQKSLIFSDGPVSHL